MPRRYLDRRAEAEIEAMLERERLAREKGAEPSEEQPGKRAFNAHHQRRGPGDWQGLVEQRILDAMERGLFDNLQGEGKPLNLDEDQFVPEDLKMAFHMLRSTGFAPLWVDLNKEIRNDIERLGRFRTYVHERWALLSAIERKHRRHEYAERVREINNKIMDYNIIAPSSSVHFGLLRLDDELAKFDQPQ